MGLPLVDGDFVNPVMFKAKPFPPFPWVPKRGRTLVGEGAVNRPISDPDLVMGFEYEFEFLELLRRSSVT